MMIWKLTEMCRDKSRHESNLSIRARCHLSIEIKNKARKGQKRAEKGRKGQKRAGKGRKGQGTHENCGFLVTGVG
jgi:hypothetical protein